MPTSVMTRMGQIFNVSKEEHRLDELKEVNRNLLATTIELVDTLTNDYVKRNLKGKLDDDMESKLVKFKSLKLRAEELSRR